MSKFTGTCFILYDGRARSGNTANAAVLISAHTEDQAISDAGDWSGYQAIWFEVDAVNGKVIKETPRPDIKVRAR